MLWIQSFSSQTFRETSWTRQTPASCSREHSKQAYSGLLFQEEHSYIGKLWPYLTLASFCWDMKQRSLLDPSWKKDPAETTGITLKLVIWNRNNWTRTQAWELLSNCWIHSILNQFWFRKFLFQSQKPFWAQTWIVVKQNFGRMPLIFCLYWLLNSRINIFKLFAGFFTRRVRKTSLIGSSAEDCFGQF